MPTPLFSPFFCADVLKQIDEVLRRRTGLGVALLLSGSMWFRLFKGVCFNLFPDAILAVVLSLPFCPFRHGLQGSPKDGRKI